jgi:hypothetical protein
VSTPESRPDFLAVTKQSAARSQLETAIRLWFYEGDPVAIHTLAVAAHDCLHAIGSSAGKPSLYKSWLKTKSKRFQQRAVATQNFFKHGFRDVHKEILFSPIHAEILMFDSTVCFREVFGRLTPLMALYGVRFAITSPDIVPSKLRPAFLAHVNAHKFGEIGRRQFIDEFLPLFEETEFLP